MTPYTKLQFHLERHMYKRGQFKGDAPADASLRGKNHLRVIKQGGNMCVRMWNTNIITVTPDNHIRISMGGWWTSTTKQNLNEAVHTFLGRCGQPSPVQLQPDVLPRQGQNVQVLRWHGVRCRG